jgi:hypothetical protein
VSVLAGAPSLINFLDALNAAVAASRRRSVEDRLPTRQAVAMQFAHSNIEGRAMGSLAICSTSASLRAQVRPSTLGMLIIQQRPVRSSTLVGTEPHAAGAARGFVS